MKFGFIEYNQCWGGAADCMQALVIKVDLQKFQALKVLRGGF